MVLFASLPLKSQLVIMCGLEMTTDALSRELGKAGRFPNTVFPFSRLYAKLSLLLSGSSVIINIAG